MLSGLASQFGAFRVRQVADAGDLICESLDVTDRNEGDELGAVGQLSMRGYVGEDHRAP